MDEIVLGDVSVTRVMEYYGSVEMSPETFFPESPDGAWQRNEQWLAPDFFDPEANICISAIQTWVLRSEGRTILVDTGVGNHKQRPHSPVWHDLDTAFLGNLAAAGVAPGDVDLVINTHLHVDHVGWNTYLDDGSWVPTFPNATYLMPRPDFEFWNPENGHHSNPGARNVFEDSVAPVHAAGLTLLWDGNFQIDPNLTLEPAPGHTPGSSVVTLRSGTDRAVFVGDMMHTALQFVEPDTNSCFCEDPVQARVTRRRILGQAADTNTLVFPAHLGGHGGAELVRDGDRFSIKEWAPFKRVTAHA
ncbi:MBL fold metallo-hydrolase [Mycolicibacterium smegmatis]|uniref:MBL fold metallo-hydrolase n=1 Tax=Mycolicibacterium smegmatis TaxID=1772 RepID=UPI00071AF886|nr:MBL fold metallo-hydrolase [Mycolicibacterium smegmatis]MDF1900776.1 MBL fold metallo-hydrolase [Mycolicibacterium smegmatis]MDF1907055.1 MBL fold metallo-hydrolase [Mycolicibacterium smegmatis]MDF1919250.1 MBL fold metallo-hydrolase [Mycolicibacterium smegmatis]MDF1925317.1 MBL fold metallo-hydrolase [Mycolicibacterium smegmatis]UAK52895.1 MBL fold metallo-hydrolase [Mycolicibacterium smegmatis]